MVNTMEKKPYITERVYVETPVDTDGDGKKDLIAVYLRLPRDLREGEKVPAIYIANPYMLTCNEDWYVPHDVNCEVRAFAAQDIKEEDIRFDYEAYEAKITAGPFAERKTMGFAEHAPIDAEPEFECVSDIYEYFNARGYATVLCGGLGTRGSEGFTLTGSREEVLAFKAVIDWLNGRCRAFTDMTQNIEIKAAWCSGNVAMTAKSYLGTMCIGVATTGVEGLKTIIPEAAISNWYAYYRVGGLNLPAMGWQGDDLDILAKYCFSRAKDAADYAKVKEAYDAALAALVRGEDRASGNYNRFWDERNYLNLVDKIKVSVFIVHGINDWNVKTNQCVPFFRELEKRGIPVKMMLHQGQHIYIHKLRDSHMLEILERWLEHYLKGVDNGIENEPAVLVESCVDQSVWMHSDTWPPADCREERVPIKATGKKLIVDDLAKTVYDKEKDNLKEWLDELVLRDDAEKQHCLQFIWDPFAETAQTEAESLRISGTVKLSFDAAIDRETAILSAMLVDLGEACRITEEEIQHPDGTYTFGLEKAPSAYKVISRGWLNAQNRSCLWSKEKIVPGEFCHYAIDMVPTDHVLASGHKLALILYGIDAEETQRPDTVTNITVDTASIRAAVPILRS